MMEKNSLKGSRTPWLQHDFMLYPMESVIFPWREQLWWGVGDMWHVAWDHLGRWFLWGRFRRKLELTAELRIIICNFWVMVNDHYSYRFIIKLPRVRLSEQSFLHSEWRDCLPCSCPWDCVWSPATQAEILQCPHRWCSLFVYPSSPRCGSHRTGIA